MTAQEIPEYAFGEAPDYLVSKSKLAKRGLLPADADAPDGYSWFRDGSVRYAVYDSRKARPIPPAPGADQRRVDKDAAAAWARDVLSDPNVVFVDTETTGLDGVIVELSAVTADGTAILDQLVNLDIPVEAKAYEVHGIGQYELAGARTLGELATVIDEALAGKRIIAWNGEFDRRALSRSYGVAVLPVPRFVSEPWDDAMAYHAAYVGQWDDTRGTYRNHRCDGEHRSASDCRAGWAKIRDMAGNLPDAASLAAIAERIRSTVLDDVYDHLSGREAALAVATEIERLA